MVLHLPPFPARLGLGQPHHADFVMLKMNAWGESLIKSTESLCKAACVTRRWAGPDQPGSQGPLASRGQRSIWGFPLCRSAPGATGERGSGAASSLSLPAVSFHLPLPGKALLAALALSFVSPPASALIPSSAAHHPS